MTAYRRGIWDKLSLSYVVPLYSDLQEPRCNQNLQQLDPDMIPQNLLRCVMEHETH